MVRVNVNCKHFDYVHHCTNKKVTNKVRWYKKLLGVRCPEFGNVGQSCQDADRYPRPDRPPQIKSCVEKI